jgi:LysM domain-containing protein
VSGSGPGRAGPWWWRREPGRVAGVAAGLLLVERLLVGEVGSPTALARTLQGLGAPGADPILSTLALMALLAEAFVGYLLLVLALRSLATLPGLTGRLARRTTFAMAPAVVRRLVDLLVGAALLAQVTVATPDLSLGHRSSGSCQAVVASSACSRPGGPVIPGDLAPVRLGAARLRLPVDEKDPVEARPIPRRSAAPLPPWLGGGPSKTASLPPSLNGGPSHAAPGYRTEARDHTVEAGDTLWDIAAANLVPAERSAATIHRYWQQVYRANRQVIGADPDLIRPGTRLDVVPFRRDHR